MYIKIIPVKGISGRCLSVRGPLPSYNTIAPLTVFLFTQVRGEGGELTREKVRGATVHKAGLKIPT
jgi:hypothetical protein